MIRVGLGQSESIDTRQAVQAVIAECKRQLQGYAPQAGIVFCGVNFDHQQMLNEIKRSFPKMEIIGCTTAGEFSTDHGFSDDSIILTTFYANDVEIKPGIGRGLSKDPAAAVKSAVGQAREKLKQKPKLCLALPDGYNKSFDPIMDMLNKHLGDDCQVFGGAAGAQWDESHQILQFYNDRIFEDSIPILLWAGSFEYSFSIANSWKPIGKKTIVTDSEGRRVRKIGDFKAVDFYRYYLGHHSEPAREFVLAVYDEGRERSFLRMRASQPGSISEVVSAMNQHLTRDVLETGRFMTLFYLSIDPKQDCIEWVRAGHDPAILYDPNRDEFEELKGPGVALGVDNDVKFKTNRKKGLIDGHVIAIGTDGIWEAFNKEGRMFGKARFREIIRQNADADADSILNAVYEQLSEYTRGQKSEDDITLVIIKINKARISC